ncbi:MAG TPA: DUF2079 domain-containing protein [Polyangiaceae bacterium]|nr:DUF2079 domain-containing protein [Polyangiaceae bacterium]
MTQGTAEPSAHDAAPAQSDAPPSASKTVQSWERTLAKAWPDLALCAYACIALAVVIWEFQNLKLLIDYVMSVEDPDSATAQADARQLLLYHVTCAAPLAVGLGGLVLWRERRGLSRLPTYWAPLAISLIGLPFLFLNLFEYRFPLFTGVIVVGLGLALGYAVSSYTRARAIRFRELSRKQAWCVVLLGWLVFTAWMGFMAHWRYITFVAQPYDMSWETNAMHTLLHTGIPRVSVAAQDYYAGKLLPVNYAGMHTPFIYYLYAPIYALYQDGRTLIWLQAAVMGAGTFGTYLVARRWLRSETMGALFGLAYVLNPTVQTLCMHDVHANIVALPMLLIALGLMEAKRPYWALSFAFITCVCREETAVYGAAAGLYWALGGRDRLRARVGWVTLLMSVGILLLITEGLMKWVGGTPRYSHFAFFFKGTGAHSVLASYLLNPLGALKLLSSPMRYEYVWLSLLPCGFLAAFGWRAAWSLLIPMGLLFPSVSHNFWVTGMNYSVPIVLPAVLLSIMGARALLLALRRRQRTSWDARRWGLSGFIALSALTGSILYGNLFGKTYKLEFGALPYRHDNQYDYIGELGIFRSLPRFGERERLLWEVVERVPDDGPITTSWRINAQLSNRMVSMFYPELGRNHPPENLAKYVVIDRLPPILEPTEDWERQMRRDPVFEVMYENPSGVIFRRKGI